MTLTYPERVTPHNIDKLRQRVSNGAHFGEAHDALCLATPVPLHHMSAKGGLQLHLLLGPLARSATVTSRLLMRVILDAVVPVMPPSLACREQHNPGADSTLPITGANTWPGANILQLQDGSKYMLRAAAIRRAADELRIGDIVQARDQFCSLAGLDIALLCCA